MAGAVERARRATAALPGVRVTRAALPVAVPGATVDLAVFSEVLYYLDDPARRDARSHLAVLAPGGDVVVVHWGGLACRGTSRRRATHRMLASRPELELLVEHVDEGSCCTC